MKRRPSLFNVFPKEKTETETFERHSVNRRSYTSHRSNSDSKLGPQSPFGEIQLKDIWGSTYRKIFEQFPDDGFPPHPAHNADTRKLTDTPPEKGKPAGKVESPETGKKNTEKPKKIEIPIERRPSATGSNRQDIPHQAAAIGLRRISLASGNESHHNSLPTRNHEDKNARLKRCYYEIPDEIIRVKVPPEYDVPPATNIEFCPRCDAVEKTREEVVYSSNVQAHLDEKGSKTKELTHYGPLKPLYKYFDNTEDIVVEKIYEEPAILKSSTYKISDGVKSAIVRHEEILRISWLASSFPPAKPEYAKPIDQRTLIEKNQRSLHGNCHRQESEEKGFGSKEKKSEPSNIRQEPQATSTGQHHDYDMSCNGGTNKDRKHREKRKKDVHREKELVDVVEDKIARGVPLDWPELFVLKNDHCRTVMPLESRVHELGLDKKNEDEVRALERLIREEYLRYEHLLDQVILCGSPYTTLAHLIMRADAYWFHARNAEDRQEKTEMYRKALEFYTGLLEKAEGSLYADDVAVLTLLQKLTRILAESASFDPELVLKAALILDKAEKRLESNADAEALRRLRVIRYNLDCVNEACLHILTPQHKIIFDLQS